MEAVPDHNTIDSSDAEKSLSFRSNSGLDSASIYTVSARHSIFDNDLFDPNLDENLEEDAYEEDSPYPEVRAAVANVDDPLMPSSTIRAWVLGLMGALVIPGMNQFFYFRYPSVMVGGLVAQLLAFPLGSAWARFIPAVSVFGLELNPGPFSIKEHVLITVMASVGAQSAYACDVVAVQRVYYHQHFSFGYQWMLVMSTQLIGFSLGGMAKRFLVSPPSMIWPNTLVQCALFNTLHSQAYLGGEDETGINRQKFFLYVFLGTIIWYFIPGYLFEALSVFSWVCWIAPNNIKVNQLFGYRSGLGFSLLTFDWNQIAYIGSPLATPWWAEANVLIGFLFFYWFLTPLLYYTNVWQAQYMPISSSTAWDNTGKPYNLTRIIDANGVFKHEEYKRYSPLYMSTTFAMSYGLSFFAITATITHALLYFWKPIKYYFRRSLRQQPDIHARLMSQYPQVPEWYYGILFVLTFIFACVCVSMWPTGMTIWALVLALIIACVYVIPIGMIQAITNRQVGLNVVTELIVGFLLPGRPVAMMIFKTYGYVTMSQAMQFTADFKLGHYMKVPPRPMFWCQVVATIVSATVQLAVQTWMFAHIPNLCSEDQRDNFICAGTQVFGTASIIWGVIGPALQFAPGQNYYGLLFFFVAGAVFPFILWCITRRYPDSIIRFINFPLMATGLQLMPPATAVNFIPWAIVGAIFQYFIRRKNFRWWHTYNYTLSAALDAGTATAVILVYFCLQYPQNGGVGANTIRAWWGNQVFRETDDWKRTPLKHVAPGDHFGSDVW